MPIHWLLSIVGIFAAVAYGLLVWQRERVRAAHEFLAEVKVELKKVTWPARREILNTTSVVIATVFFFGLYLSLIDLAVSKGRDVLFNAVAAGGAADAGEGDGG